MSKFPPALLGFADFGEACQTTKTLPEISVNPPPILSFLEID